MGEKSGQWKVLADEPRDSFKIFETRRSKRENPRTGKPFEFFLMRGLDWVNVIPVTVSGEVVLVKQYRHGSDRLTIEIPGGCVEPGEDPATSGLRELFEETGYRGKTAELLGVTHANPAMQSMRCHSYIARDVERHGEQTLDAGEDIEVLTIPFEKAIQMVREGTIDHALVVAAFGYLALEYPELVATQKSR